MRPSIGWSRATNVSPRSRVRAPCSPCCSSHTSSRAAVAADWRAVLVEYAPACRDDALSRRVSFQAIGRQTHRELRNEDLQTPGGLWRPGHRPPGEWERSQPVLSIGALSHDRMLLRCPRPCRRRRCSWDLGRGSCGPVIAHCGAGVGVTRGDLDIAQVDSGIEHCGDEGVSEHVGVHAWQLHAGLLGEPSQPSGGAVPVHAGAARGQQDRAPGAGADRAVDGSSDRGRRVRTSQGA